jgi:hypothetical protein
MKDLRVSDANSNAEQEKLAWLVGEFNVAQERTFGEGIEGGIIFLELYTQYSDHSCATRLRHALVTDRLIKRGILELAFFQDFQSTGYSLRQRHPLHHRSRAQETRQQH